jgi:heptosyltransferase III
MPNSENYTKPKKINKRNPRIIISRTDNIGDVILTLPMAGAIKKAIPGAYIIFLGKTYTKEIVEMSEHVDEFVDWDLIKNQTISDQIQCFKKLNADYIVHALAVKQIAQLAKKTGIRKRIGASGRLYNWQYCNKIIFYTRRRSKLHESQLNIRLLRAFGIKRPFSLQDIIKNYGIVPPNSLSDIYRNMIDNSKFNLLLHPKSKGSTREWGLNNYSELIKLLPKDKFKIFISGTSSESEIIQTELIARYPDIIDLSGKLSLIEFISFIANADGLVSCSTGPLHIAAALGKYAIGIFPPIKPMHPGRWAPVGANATFLVLDKKCNKCRLTKQCECIQNISPEMVKNKLMEIFKTDSSFVNIL